MCSGWTSPWRLPMVCIIIYHLGLKLLYYHKRGKKEPCTQLVPASETTIYTLTHFLSHTVNTAIHYYCKIRVGNWEKNETHFPAGRLTGPGSPYRLRCSPSSCPAPSNSPGHNHPCPFQDDARLLGGFIFLFFKEGHPSIFPPMFMYNITL